MAHMSELATIQPNSKNPVNVRIGRNVRDIMFARDLNQVALALALGLTESQVSRRIGGKVDWTPADLETTAHTLQVSVGRLFQKLPDLDSNQEPIGSKPAQQTGELVDLDAVRQQKLDAHKAVHRTDDATKNGAMGA